MTQRQDQLQYQLGRQDERLSRLLDALELGESAAVRERLQQREAERAHLAAQLAKVQQLRQRASIELSPTALQQLVDNVRRVLQSSGVHKARRMLGTLVVRVEGSKRGGVLYYTFSPDLTGLWMTHSGEAL